ncbi:MAG TPA: alpha/beta hydrolase [Pseudomonadota bacterium]|nr:alpha/beta hydrolase [Pseudomonadota bacterium]
MNTLTLESADGTPLRVDAYSTQRTEPRGVVVVVHGFAEHRRRYEHLANFLSEHGFHVLTGDLRGHGESGGERGYIERFSNYVDDVSAFVRTAEETFSMPNRAQPILFGHSMGGLVCSQFVLATKGAVRALAMTSPFFGIKLAVPSWKRALGLGASLVYPKLKLPNGIDGSVLSHDTNLCKAYEQDPFVFHTATARWFSEVLAIHADSLNRASQIKLPTLMLLAGDDRLTDAQAADRVFDRLGSRDKTMKTYPGMFHEILNELERQRVYDDLLEWLQKH